MKVVSRAKGHTLSFGLGDWYARESTPAGLTGTAFYYFDSSTVARVANLVGHPDDAVKYNALAAQILTAFTREFFNPQTNNYASGSLGSNALPLAMGMVAPAVRPAVLANLVKRMKASGSTAGEVSLKYVLEALAADGHSDLIYTTYGTDKSGYGRQVKEGKTSLTEGWDGGSSQDHFMFGQINEWFYHDLAGIQNDPHGQGFHKIIIRPSVVGDLTEASATYDSVSGPIASHWKRDGNRLTLNVTIPPNTTATVYVPAGSASRVQEGSQPASRSTGVTLRGMEDGAAVFGVSSGHYSFASLLKAH